MKLRQRRSVQSEITRALIQGKVLATYKTKALVGRKSVTVGRYLQSTGGRNYSLIIGADAEMYLDAISAAQAFIEYVGRDDAWDALHGRGRERNPR